MIRRYGPDLVLLDIYLYGDERGTVLGEELRAEGQLPFIYITSHTDRGTLAIAKATRPNGYLVKPFTREDVFVAIEIAMVNYAHEKIDAPNPAIPGNTEGPAKLKKTVAHIRANLDKKITLTELAELSGWNVYHFARTFKKYMGVSPYQYSLQARMERGRELLSSTENSIRGIAGVLGFDSHSHFSRTFRKQVGVSPEEYRQKKSRS